MKKILKRIMALSLCACMMMGAASTASAASYNTLGSNQVSFDTQLGHYFHVYGNNNRYLNMYTSGTPTNGTKVTTWSRIENDPTQAWDIGYLADGSFIIVVNNNRNLAIDFNRNTPDVQLYSWVGDYYDDVVMGQGLGPNEPIKLVNRNSYLNVTNTNTAVYDANGKVCVWNSTPTTWVHHLDW